MHESAADLTELQRLLDEREAAAGEHLRSIFTPQRRMSAKDVVALLKGVFVLNVATVTAAGEPLVAPLDGLFSRGRLLFGFPPGSVRGRHLRARPQVSAVYSEDESACVIAHGRAREIDLAAPDHADALAYCKSVYGASWDYWHTERYRDRGGRGYNGLLVPRRMYAMQSGRVAAQDT